MQATKRQRLSDQGIRRNTKAEVKFSFPKMARYLLFDEKVRSRSTRCFLNKNEEQINVIHHPIPFDRMKSMQQSKKRRIRLLTEIEGRTGDFNTGGSNKLKIMTSYKENCIHIACCLIHHGPLSSKSLREIGTGEKTYQILHKNYEGWFEKIERGIYGISETGINGLKEYPELVEYYNELTRYERK